MQSLLSAQAGGWTLSRANWRPDPFPRRLAAGPFPAQAGAWTRLPAARRTKPGGLPVVLPSEAVRVAGLGVQVLSVRCTDIAVLVEREHGHGELGSVAGQGGERLGYLQRGVEREQRVRRAPVKRADRLGDIAVAHISPAVAVRECGPSRARSLPRPPARWNRPWGWPRPSTNPTTAASRQVPPIGARVPASTGKPGATAGKARRGAGTSRTARHASRRNSQSPAYRSAPGPA